MQIFRAWSLASGSSGNAIAVESEDGVLLVDAGISAARIASGLDLPHNPDRLCAAIITHDHRDHIAGARILAKRWRVPIYLSAGTHRAAYRALGDLPGHRYFRPGDMFEIAGFRVRTIPTPHDSAEPAAVTIERRGRRCGVFTDLGHPFPGLGEAISELDAVFLESNYDPRMLAEGDYPAFLKNRIRSPAGHLANEEAAALVRDYGCRLQAAVLAHLSAHNNRPEIALQTFHAIAGDAQRRGLRCFTAPRYEPSEMIAIAM